MCIFPVLLFQIFHKLENFPKEKKSQENKVGGSGGTGRERSERKGKNTREGFGLGTTQRKRVKQEGTEAMENLLVGEIK